VSYLSKDLRRFAYQALMCAQATATTQKIGGEMSKWTADTYIKTQSQTLSEAAYAASAHAWMAMIALVGRELTIAQQAAQAASDAERTVARCAFTLGLDHAGPCPLDDTRLPDERSLLEMWTTFCRSLPAEFPVPETLDHSLLLHMNS